MRCRLTRRRVLSAVAPAALTALAAACDLPPGPLAKPKVIVVAAPAGAAAYEDVTAAVERAASPANSASRPAYTIRVARVPLPERPTGGAPLARALTPMLAGGTAPEVALVVSRGNDVSLPAGEVQDLVAGRLLAPLDDLERNDKSFRASNFAAAALDALRHQGKSYARPLSVEPLVLYYDLDLFRAAGLRPPESTWDWALLRDAAGRLTQQSPGGTAEQWGLYSFPPLWYLLTLIWQNGGDVLAADGRTSTLTAAPAVEAMQYLYDLVAVRRVSPPPPAPNASSPYDLRYQNGRIMAGPARVAMAIGPGAPNLRQALLDYGLPDV